MQKGTLLEILDKKNHLLNMVQEIFPQPITRRQILDSFKLKEFVDDNFKFDKIGRKFSKQVENTVGKGEIACNEQFLLFPQCFQKACFPGAPKEYIVWEWVKLGKVLFFWLFFVKMLAGVFSERRKLLADAQDTIYCEHPFCRHLPEHSSNVKYMLKLGRILLQNEILSKFYFHFSRWFQTRFCAIQKNIVISAFACAEL